MSHVRLKFLIQFLFITYCLPLLMGCFNNKYDDVDLTDEIKLQLQMDVKPSILPISLISPIFSVDIPKVQHSILGELKDPMSRSDGLSPQNIPAVITSIKGLDPYREIGYIADELEQFSVQALVLLGVMISHDGGSVAVFRTPAGTVRQVHVGDYIGDQFEKIVLITDAFIKVEKQINQVPVESESRTILVSAEAYPK